MKKSLIISVALLLLLEIPAPSASNFRDGGKKVGQGFKEIGLATCHAARDSGKAIGKGFKKAGTETGRAFKTMGKEIGQAFSGR